jgi:hypothetical protein
VYLGNDLQVAFPSYRNIDDISSAFNGVTTSFPLLINGSAPVPAPLGSNQCLISVNGVVQKPDDTGTTGFRLSGGNIIFSSAPAGAATFFGVVLAGADYVNAGANFPDGTLSAPSITFDQDNDTGYYRSGSGAVSFAANGVAAGTWSSAGVAAPALIPTGSTVPSNGVYLPSTNNVAISTNGTGRLFVDSSGNVGLGSSSPGENLTLSSTAAAAVVFGINTPSGQASRIQFKRNNSNRFKIECDTNDNFIFYSDAFTAERLRINSSGVVFFGNGENDASPTNSIISATGGSGTNITGAALTIRGGQGTGTGAGGPILFSTAPAGTTGTTLNAASERMRITAAGNVGIGTTSPSFISGSGLEIYDSSVPRLKLTNSTTGTGSSDGLDIHINNTDANIVVRENFPLILWTNNTERARIDSSGRLLVGTSTARAAGGHTGRFQLEGANFNDSTASITYNANDGDCGYVHFIKTRSGNTVVQSGDGLGAIKFFGTDGSAPIIAAQIRSEVDGTPGSNDMPGRLVFSTTADGASSPTERFRIANNGAWGLAGANYGSSAQVLTSNGSGSAPTWQAAPAPAALSTASGSAPSYSARAWVNFNGTGTVAIRASGNVSSITDNGTGDYTVNFTTAMPDANYSVVCGQCDSNNGRSFGVLDARATAPGTHQLTSSVRLRNAATSTDTLDVNNASVAIFR